MSEPHEIIIIRRRHGDHDGHHGGVWKIAFADFMTAMMAFFLVLWIVNSTSKETRSSIARYFNPIKLSDTTPARKGLQDPRDTDFDASAPHKPETPKPPTQPQAGPGGSSPAIGKPSPETGAPRTIESRDSETIGGTQNEASTGPVPAGRFTDPFELLRPKVDRHGYGEDRERQPVEPPAPPVEPAMPVAAAAAEKPEPGGTSGSPSAAGETGQGSTATMQAPPVESAEQQLKQSPLGTMVQSILKQEKDILAENNIQVREVAEGTLISLLDNNRNAMFQSGSASLSDEATAALARIAKAISKLPNGVIVSGYTDSSPYRGGQNNNWRLSALRAEAALNVLLASGVAAPRIERIEGHADRSARDPGGAAPQNRRIDILVRKSNG